MAFRRLVADARLARLAPWFITASCLSAVLLFAVQPLFAKLALPSYGGAASVWTTAMLFFQTLLLAGYAYAHWLARQLRGWQVGVHAAVIALGALTLPIAAPADWAAPLASDPLSTSLSLLALLAISVGPAYFAMSANAPLIQHWYAGAGSRDPFFLYAASNVGSFGALLAFPFLLEPVLDVDVIGWGWAVGYGVFALILAVCAVVFLLRPHQMSAAPSTKADAADAPDEAAPLTARRVAVWIALAAIPSSLMLGVTSKISTDVGAIPLIWIAPLALYLASFVVAFSGFGQRLSRLFHELHGLTLVILVLLLAIGLPIAAGWTGALLLLGALFIIATSCHLALAARRPGVRWLTAFYLAMSIGGAIGGLFNAIAAPMLFTQIWEFPIALALSAFALTGVRDAAKTVGKAATAVRGRLIIAGVAAALLIAFAIADLFHATAALPQWAALFALVIGGGLAMTFALRSAVALTLASVTVLSVGAVVSESGDRVMETRSFYGAYRVMDFPEDDLRVFLHGTTRHGAQRISDLGAEGRPTPLAYYYPEGPFGQVLSDPTLTSSDARIAAVGLGVGALACYAQPDQVWTHFEIDPVVAEIARDPAYFSYLDRCQPDAEILMGDARRMLAERAGAYDVIVLDAFSSDAVPLHLLTVEAMALYADRLAPDGTLLLHASNRYYHLAPPIAAAADQAGLTAVVQWHEGPPADGDPTAGSASIVLALRHADAAPKASLENAALWEPVVGLPDRPWTDARSSVIGHFR